MATSDGKLYSSIKQLENDGFKIVTNLSDDKFPVEYLTVKKDGKEFELVPIGTTTTVGSGRPVYKIGEQIGGKRKNTKKSRKSNKSKKSKTHKNKKSSRKSKNSKKSRKSKKSLRNKRRNKRQSRRRRRNQRGGSKLFPADGINQSSATCPWNPQPATVGKPVPISNPSETLTAEGQLNHYEYNPRPNLPNDLIQNTSINQFGGGLTSLVPQDLINLSRSVGHSVKQLGATWNAETLPLSDNPSVLEQGLHPAKIRNTPINMPKILNNADSTAAAV